MEVKEMEQQGFYKTALYCRLSQDDKKEKQPDAPKKNEPEDKPVEEGLVVKELKQHTRYLRDLSGNGLGAKFA
jgi:hypothetical protein